VGLPEKCSLPDIIMLIKPKKDRGVAFSTNGGDEKYNI
jgi:hypothetical protein